MSRLIEEGDVVALVYTDKVLRDMVVVSCPQDIGDSWFVQDEDGRVALINVYAWNFECMLEEKETHG
jgi:hypothetical protein